MKPTNGRILVGFVLAVLLGLLCLLIIPSRLGGTGGQAVPTATIPKREGQAAQTPTPSSMGGQGGQTTPTPTLPKGGGAGEPTATPPKVGGTGGLVLPDDFAAARAAAIAQLQQSQASLRIERVADSATALTRLTAKQAQWAVSAGRQPSPTARLLCLAPYVPIVHFSSPLEEISAARLQEILEEKDWPGPVYYSGDPKVLLSIVGLDRLGPDVTALPSWQAVIERVAADRSAIAFAPWSEVDVRVKTLALEGRSIAVNGTQGYAIGDAWWLSAAANAPVATTEAIAKQLACPITEPVTFLAAGDMLMGWYVNDIYIKKEGPEYLFRRVADLIRSADIAFANFENPMSDRGVMENKGLMFRAPLVAVKGLTFAGIDVVNLANNHLGDYGPTAVLDTLDILRQNGIAYVGAGRNRTEARSSWITTTKGVRIAILAYNEIEPGYFAATESRPGTAWIEPENVYAEIRKARSQADFVIASFHWGEEYTPHPNSRQQEIARRAAEAGAGLIVGHHPHVVQGVGFFGNVFVNYSIGDFVYSQPTRPATGEGIILRAVIEGSRLKQVQMLPIYIDRAQPCIISPVEAKLMMARIFDATRLYKGLSTAGEQATTSVAAVLPQSTTRAPTGGLSFVALNGQQADIALWSATTPIIAKITTSGALNDAPAWSPDGKRIAYSAARDGTVDIFVAAADGSGAVNVTRHPAWDDYPAWSPDGTRIAFSSNRDGDYNIYIMNADGTGLRRLTENKAWDTTPAWSPDGKRIAFASDRSGVFQIYTVALDGSDLRQLTKHVRLAAFPSWSPDGTKIVYQSYEDESFHQGDDSVQDRDYEIMVIPATGGTARRLTNNAFADIHPVWSPDGTKIAFASDRNGMFQIYVMNADGSGATAVTNGPGAFVSPAWAP